LRIEILVSRPAITDDRSAGFDPCICNDHIKVPAVLSGTGTRNVLPDRSSTLPNTHCPLTGWPL
jgi:hypothetical protein